MGGDKWFRRRTWTVSDQADFEERFQRARAATKPQYLRIQAVHLAEAGEARAALGLLDRLLADFPSSLDVAIAQDQRARCLVALGDFAGATEAFRVAVDHQRKDPRVRTSAYLDFCWLVVTRNETALLREAARILDENAGEPRPFPIQQFKWEASRALLADARGDAAAARAHALAALALAAKGATDLRHHPDIGLVGEVEPAAERRLQLLAATAP